MFTGEVDCTYFFTWDTKFACVKEKEDLLCGASEGKRRYDLSVLVRHSGIHPLLVDLSSCVQLPLSNLFKLLLFYYSARA